LAGRSDIKLADLMNERWVFSEQSNVVTSLVSAAFRTQGLALPQASVVKLR
jgi:hypothetical protein